MKNLYALLLSLILCTSLCGQNTFLSFHTGYGGFSFPVSHQNIHSQSLSISQSNIDDDVTSKKWAEYSPFIIQLQFGNKVEFGFKYQSMLDKPEIEHSISGLELVGITERYSHNTFGLFTKAYTAYSHDSPGSFSPYFGLEVGKKWGKKKVTYSDEYIELSGAGHSTEKFKFKGTYYVALHGGLSYNCSDALKLEMGITYYPFDRIRLAQNTTADKIQHIQLNVGIKVPFGVRFDRAPCRW